MSVFMLKNEHRWSCPNCTLTQVTHENRPHTRFHACPGLKGMTAPMIKDGTDCKVQLLERQDYVGKEKGLPFDEDGTPYMAVETVREDGNDLAVYAPTATMRMGA